MTWPSSLAGDIILGAANQQVCSKGTMDSKLLTDKVTALEVEAVQLVASLFCIHYVVIDNEGSTLCVGSDALADLTVGRTLALWTTSGGA